jgi:Icc-related predicted phosphoesterase
VLARGLLLLSLLLLPLAADVRAQNLTKLPMMQSFRQSELRVQWETDSNPVGTVHALDYGLASPSGSSVLAQETIALAADRFVHRAVATGLATDTAYVYRVRSGPTQSATYTARTAPAAGSSFRMAFVADNQNQVGASFQSVLERIVPFAPDAIGHAGDTVQNGDVLAEWQTQYFDPFAGASNLGQRTPVLVARGNHDANFPPALAYHWLPNNNFWYAETIGNVRFVFLASHVSTAPAQDAFLAAELASPASQSAEFRVAVFHHPPYTNLWDQPGYDGQPHQRDVWVPLFEQHGVDLVINGHAHCYSRGAQNGVMYTIVGGAGGALDTVFIPPGWPFIAIAQPIHHFAILDIAPGRLAWRAIDLAGNEFDSFELSASPGVPAFPTGAREW